MRIVLFVLLALSAASASSAQLAPRRPTPTVYSFEDPALDAITAPELTRFDSEAAFQTYLDRLAALQKRRERFWISTRRSVRLYAQAQPGNIPCPPNQVCPEEGVNEIVTTAAKAAPSITNNQKAGVDEGDIVKQIGPFLLVLQDGRIFSIDTRDGLRLADRRNVYRDPKSDTWYDEMLVQGDHILITAYGYAERASEISVFALDRATGRIAPDGVFLISSDDYYDSSNYATRIVGDRLVIYTPYDLDTFRSREGRPLLRRWQTEAERSRSAARARPVLDATDIYRPVQRTSAPTLHTVSICPLGRRRAGEDLTCRATAFLAPDRAEMFVSPDDVFLWTTPGWDEVGWTQDCAAGTGRQARRDVLPAGVFRLPVNGDAPSVAGANGVPFNQFSMDSNAREFRALVAWQPFRCDRNYEMPVEVAYLRAPLDLFGPRLRPVTDARLTPVPSPGRGRVENRFADQWLVYAGQDGWGSYPPDEDDPPQSGVAVAVPTRDPKAARTFDLPHNVIRIERVGDDMVLNGYRDLGGLSVTYMKLGAAPHVASHALLPNRFESEGRSHAFNSWTAPDASGTIGIPTVKRDIEAGRWAWRSDTSDVSFLELTSTGQLSSVGEILARKDEAADDDYDCEVSCIDWYGNSRPIFTEGRIFALMGTEMVEARIAAGRIGEIRRLNLTRAVGETATPVAGP